MKKNNTLRKMASAVAFALLMTAAVACTSNKKYGCPNHLNVQFTLR